MRQLVEKIIQRWFVSDPALFRTICLFNLSENGSMSCPVRIGSRNMAVGVGVESMEMFSREKGLRNLEYNPEMLRDMTEQEVAEYLKCEMIRVLLKHPYERLPEGCTCEACSIGSNIVLGGGYPFRNISLQKAGDYGLQEDQIYEWYCRRIQELGDRQIEQSGGAGADILDSSRMSDLSEHWQEDQFMLENVNSVIRQCEEGQDWGTLPGNFVEQIKASTKTKINWRTVLTGFRASILSSKRKLTRMRPSRRFDFDQMGSIREFDTKLLVALDVSGSVSDEDISRFLGVVNSIFRYGITQVDVIQFDMVVTTTMTLKKALNTTVAIGRGGTCFQPAVDYAVENHYDGLVILTDGYAPKPAVPHRTTLKIAWVCSNESSYERHHEWMSGIGRVCTMEIG